MRMRMRRRMRVRRRRVGRSSVWREMGGLYKNEGEGKRE